MENPFGRVKRLEAQLADLKAVSESRGRRIAALENQIKNRTGIEYLDPEGVLALLTYRELLGEPEGSNRDFSVLKRILGHRSIRNTNAYSCEDGSILLCGDLYKIPVDTPSEPSEAKETDESTIDEVKPESESATKSYRIVAYDVLLPAAIRYGNLLQIATILSPLYFKNLGHLLDIDEEFFVFPGKLESYTEDGVERNQIVLLPPDFKSVVVIGNSNIEERQIDFESYRVVAERQAGSVLSGENLKTLKEFYSDIMDEYFEEWYVPLEGIDFISPGAKD